jgi:hypothetical protein
MLKQVQFLAYEWLTTLEDILASQALIRVRKARIFTVQHLFQFANRDPPTRESPSRSPSPEEPPLPLVVFHLYIRRPEKYMTGVMSEPIDLNSSFEAVLDELVSHVLDKIGDINGRNTRSYLQQSGSQGRQLIRIRKRRSKMAF